MTVHKTEGLLSQNT